MESQQNIKNTEPLGDYGMRDRAVVDPINFDTNELNELDSEGIELKQPKKPARKNKSPPK